LLSKHNFNGCGEGLCSLREQRPFQQDRLCQGIGRLRFQRPDGGRSKYVRRSAFKGELYFTSDIYAVSNPQALKTYFLYGHGENNPGARRASRDLGPPVFPNSPPS
jgi:hypothetical protein